MFQIVERFFKHGFTLQHLPVLREFDVQISRSKAVWGADRGAELRKKVSVILSCKHTFLTIGNSLPNF